MRVLRAARLAALLAAISLSAYAAPDNIAAATKRLRAEVVAQSKERGVVIFTGNDCPICARAKAYFHEKNIDFVEYDIDETQGNRTAFQSFGVKGIPLIVVSGHIMRGFSPQAFEARFQLAPGR